MNKLIFLFFISGLLLACKTGSIEVNERIEENRKLNFEKISAWDSLLANHEVRGAILVLDSIGNIFYGNDSLYSTQGYLPASTFKIPNTLIGLESGVLEDETTMYYWDGERRYLRSWEKDMNLAEAFQASCLPCYQEMTRKIGTEVMQRLVDTLNYGNMIFDGDNYDSFWVQGASKISPFEQIAFLQRIYSETLPVEKKHLEILKEIMIAKKEPAYILSAKTGWSIQDGINQGWYVGRMKKQGKVYYFATHVAPVNQEETTHFAKARIEVSLRAMEILMDK